MCIQAILIVNASGRLLYFRNYAGLSQFLLEDFAYGLQTSVLKNDQHIFATHGAHRLVYLPIETCLLVLVTELASNIIEDVESIGRIKEAVTGLMEGEINEESVFDRYVDLTMAFDEMISLKARTLFTTSQISTLLSLESANENMQKKILQEKANEAMKKNQAQMKQLERSQKVKEMIREEVSEIDRQIKEMSGDMPDTPQFEPQPMSRPMPSVAQKTNIQLGGMKKKIHSERKKSEVQESVTQVQEEKPKFNPLDDEVRILLEERISGILNSSGEVQKFELKGALAIFIENDAVNRIELHTEGSDNKGFVMRLPPNYDKSLWSQGLLKLKPKSAAVAKHTVVETLKYSLATPLTTETSPFKINFWFSGTQFSCELEFNSSQNLFKSLQNVEVHFSKLAALDFEVSEAENSETVTNSQILTWRIPQLNRSQATASLIVDFEQQVDENSVLPATLDLSCDSTLLDLKLHKVCEEDGREVKFGFKRTLGAKDFSIEA